MQRNYFPTPPGLKSYSIYVDSERKCLIADQTNRRLVSINPDSTIEEYKCPSIREPYAMTFLSNGTLCVTDSSKSLGTYGGIAVLSEFDLKSNV
jgi:streptogramin lyase